MNGADILVIIFVAALVAAAVVIMIRNKRGGKHSCGCDCSNCMGCANDHNRSSDR